MTRTVIERVSMGKYKYHVEFEYYLNGFQVSIIDRFNRSTGIRDDVNQMTEQETQKVLLRAYTLVFEIRGQIKDGTINKRRTMEMMR